MSSSMVSFEEEASLILISNGSARVLTTLIVCWFISSIRASVDLLPLKALQAILIASAAAVASSSKEAFAMSIPVKSEIIV